MRTNAPTNERPVRTNPAGDPAADWEGSALAYWQREWAVPRLEIYHRIGSTNDRARDLAEDGAPGGSVVLADHQSAGRGRQGRRWHASPGQSLLLSLIVRPDKSDDQAAAAPGAAPLLVGLAVARAVERCAPFAIGIKWPNDLVTIDGNDVARGKMGGRKATGPGAPHRKLAGILCEASLTGADPYVIAGIGLNVSQGPGDWPHDVRERATSLVQEASPTVARPALAAAIISEVRRIMPRIARPLRPAELSALSERDVLLGHRVRADGPSTMTGVACGIFKDGALRIRLDSGRIDPLYQATVRRTDGGRTDE